MIRIVIRALVFLASAALGILAASWLLEGDFTVTPSGFTIAVVVFAVVQSVLSPFITTMALRFAPAFLGGSGSSRRFVALLIASLVDGGLEVSGARSWVLGTVVVWLVTALGSVLLPLVFLRSKASDPTARARGARAA